ncbi:MAG TPA: hypothetical protein VGU74_08885 [Gemmatimonadales bacterium]|nr:hypothetical protein [Gemmatimonadales bacterium]
MTMSDHSSPASSILSSHRWGANLVALAGIALVGYGLMFLIRNFTRFIELGLTPERIGGTPEQIRAFSPHLYNYISHLQVAVAGLMIGLGVAVGALAWRGIRTGQRWALWAAFVAALVAVVVAVPLHYVYGLAALGHLGPIYVVVAILVVGTVLARGGVR